MLNGNGHHVNETTLHVIGDDHVGTAYDTPIREDAFDLSDEEKMEKIAANFREIMHTLGLDLSDDSLNGTPRRVAKMYVKEIFQGLDPNNKPAATLFDNKYKYKQMLIEKMIPVQSTCEHHFQPIYGKAHIAYISSGKVIGLSKLNRIVDYYSRRPQVQERLTHEVLHALDDSLKPHGVAVVIEAAHMCMMMRGVQKQNSMTTTSAFVGAFEKAETRNEFLRLIGQV